MRCLNCILDDQHIKKTRLQITAAITHQDRENNLVFVIIKQFQLEYWVIIRFCDPLALR
tara:strand:- start:271 stop:447 length:177 start_codon:yes stop_codon:yes gene_type:complete